jgi:hypothetical protein
LISGGYFQEIPGAKTSFIQGKKLINAHSLLSVSPPMHSLRRLGPIDVNKSNN